MNIEEKRIDARINALIFTWNGPYYPDLLFLVGYVLALKVNFKLSKSDQKHRTSAIKKGRKGKEID